MSTARNRTRRSLPLLSGVLALTGCAHTGHFQPFAVSPRANAVAIDRLSLTPAARARLALPFSAQRAAMVADIRHDIRQADPAADDAALEQALAVIGAVPREDFVPKSDRRFAYLPIPLSIGHDQTISDAYVVALMTAVVHVGPNAHVLDVGTGSGYQAAVLAHLATRVSSIEIVKPLAETAARRLHRLRLNNVEVRAGDGYAGWQERAPFDAIIVAAGAAEVPRALLGQLRPGGRLVMPIGPSTFQEQLVLFTKARDGTFTRCSLGPTSFVPFVGRGARPPMLAGLYDRTIPFCFASPVT